MNVVEGCGVLGVVGLIFAGASFLMDRMDEEVADRMKDAEDHFLMDSAYEIKSPSEDVSRAVVVLPKDPDGNHPVICSLVESDGSFKVDYFDNRTLPSGEDIRNATPQFCERVFDAAQKGRGEEL